MYAYVCVCVCSPWSDRMDARHGRQYAAPPSCRLLPGHEDQEEAQEQRQEEEEDGVVEVRTEEQEQE